ncbi:MAG: YafY family protein [Candidatus Margulisiibacteriota bacterium]
MERHTFIRIAEIDKLVKEKQYPNCRFLAQKFEVSERTVLRDIEAMKDSLGAEIEYDREHNGYYYVNDGFNLPALKLSEGELIAIFLGQETLNKYKSTPFAAAIKQAFQKIEVLLPSTMSIDFDFIGQSYSFDNKDTKPLDNKSAKTFDLLTKAISEKASIEINYYAIGKNISQRRIVDPYHLRHEQGTWYLVGWCHLRKDTRIFAVAQIKSIQVLKVQFEVKSDFSPERYFANSWGFERGGKLGNVIVKLSKEIARWFVDRKLHPSQKTKENKDGSITLSFQVEGTNEIRRWILSLGGKARVIAPSNLKKEIKNEAKEIIVNG